MVSEDDPEHSNSLRVKQMVVWRIEILRRKEAPPLVYVEPAQLPQEGVLAARVLSCVLQPADKTSEPRVTSHAACAGQLTNSCRRGARAFHVSKLQPRGDCPTQSYGSRSGRRDITLCGGGNK